jgi:hypothetical protein
MVSWRLRDQYRRWLQLSNDDRWTPRRLGSGNLTKGTVDRGLVCTSYGSTLLRSAKWTESASIRLGSSY